MIAASSHLGHDVCMPSSGAWVIVAACRCLGCEGRLLGSGSVCVSLGKGVRGVNPIRLSRSGIEVFLNCKMYHIK